MVKIKDVQIKLKNIEFKITEKHYIQNHKERLHLKSHKKRYILNTHFKDDCNDSEIE